MGAIVELRHLIVLPGLVSVWKERRPLGVQSTDGLRRNVNIKHIFRHVEKWNCNFLQPLLDMKTATNTRNDKHTGVIVMLWIHSGTCITVARQMKLVTFVQSQMNIRWRFPSDGDQSFPTECFLEEQSPCSCSLSEKTNVLQWRSAY